MLFAWGAPEPSGCCDGVQGQLKINSVSTDGRMIEVNVTYTCLAGTSNTVSLQAYILGRYEELGGFVSGTCDGTQHHVELPYTASYVAGTTVDLFAHIELTTDVDIADDDESITLTSS